MSRRRITVIVLLLLILNAGCANFEVYFRDRANDFVDCFAAEAGICLGFGARVQCTNYISGAVGASFTVEKVGFCGREIINEKDTLWVGIPIIQLVYAPAYGVFVGMGGFELEGGGILPGLGTALSFFLCTDIVARDSFLFLVNGRASLLFLNLDFLWGRLIGLGPGYDAGSPFFADRFFIGVSVTVGSVGFDVGFNPAQFIDFLLGWFTIDIADDDNARYRPRLRIGPEPP